MKKALTPKDLFKKAYRMARHPDSFLADPTKIDFDIRYFLAALKCSGFQYATGSGFKGALK